MEFKSSTLYKYQILYSLDSLDKITNVKIVFLYLKKLLQKIKVLHILLVYRDFISPIRVYFPSLVLVH